jgi:tetratricopeptide (TPR) repeat protein/SAM-dependent methyltransferase
MDPSNRQGAPQPDVTQAFLVAARHHQAGRIAEAESLYRQVLALNPRHAESLYYLGVIQLRAGRPQQAVDFISRAIAVADGNPEYHYNIAIAYQALGHIGEVVTHCARAITLKPDYAEAHMNLGNALKQQGKLAEAAKCYKRVIGLRPDSAAAYYNLGNVLAADAPGDAIAHYQRALALDPDFAEVHNNLANVLLAQGKLQDVGKHVERALALNPKLTQAYITRGNLLAEQGQVDEATAQFWRALELNSQDADAHISLAALLLAQGNPDGAEEHFRQAAEARPELAEAHNYLGTVLMALGRSEDAIECFRRALACRDDFVEAYNNLARAQIADGKPALALGVSVRALEARDTEDTKILLVRCLKAVAGEPDAAGLRDVIVRAMTESWGAPEELAGIAANVLKSKGEVADCIKRANDSWPNRPSADLLLGASLGTVAADPLLHCLLTRTPVADAALERFLTAMRHALLDTATRTTEAEVVDDDVLALTCALAQQCFLNGYVFPPADEEIERARRLRDEIAAALSSGAAIPLLRIVAIAAYAPLHTLPDAPALLGRSSTESWPEPMLALLNQQVREPREEIALRQSIPRLSAVDEGARFARRDSDTGPHPRWTSAAPVGKRAPVDKWLRGLFPLAFFRPLGRREPLDVLVVACATGRAAIDALRRLTGARVLATDGALANLAFARRKTLALDLHNIEYAQADPMKLDVLERSFDVILATGALHRIVDPLAGWRALLGRLRPGGFMAVGLLSEPARRERDALHAFMRERGITLGDDDVRRARDALATLPDDAVLKAITRRAEFFTMDGCRDLMMSGSGHQPTLPQIDTFVAENDLELLGIEVEASVLQRYRRKYPQDRTMTDLTLCRAFETDNPAAFGGMYRVWVQKRGAP